MGLGSLLLSLMHSTYTKGVTVKRVQKQEKLVKEFGRKLQETRVRDFAQGAFTDEELLKYSTKILSLLLRRRWAAANEIGDDGASQGRLRRELWGASCGSSAGN